MKRINVNLNTIPGQAAPYSASAWQRELRYKMNTQIPT